MEAKKPRTSGYQASMRSGRMRAYRLVAIAVISRVNEYLACVSVVVVTLVALWL